MPQIFKEVHLEMRSGNQAAAKKEPKGPGFFIR